MPGRPRTWLRVWLLVTGAATLTASLMDAALLQRRRGYFTGGFLSTDHIRHAADALAFVVGSLLSDAAVVGVLAADRDPHQVLAHARGLEVVGAHLLVGGAGRVDDQGLGVADVGEVRRQPDGLDEPPTGFSAAHHAEACP